MLNGHPNVRAETQTRVRNAIEELGYHRNLSARALVTRKTRILGVVAFDTTLYGPASTLLGIEQAAREAGYFVSIVSLRTITRQTVSEALNHLAEQSVDGVIVIAPQRSAVEALADLPAQRPLVAVEGGRANGTPVVCVDQVGGAYAATRHLLDCGYHTVHHVAGPLDWLEAEGRVTGWRQALTEADCPIPEPYYGDWSPRSGFEIGLRLAADSSHGVSAVFVANDQMALGVLRALAESGLRVPEDVSVVGFDDVPEAEFFTPPLTTVRQDFTEVGERAIQMLLDLLAGNETSRRDGGAAREVVPARLVQRMSTVSHP
ncbi:LacI family DNA-binding transcriptional regulator [Salinactinospora qingdaonensis]|uniref:LacI family DNA-binding transcriptional regulator n=1 Tax=Salinactinospora qingdaonensis TaxID=702744 RepID=A0ABP7FVU6_9ACTN